MANDVTVVTNFTYGPEADVADWVPLRRDPIRNVSMGSVPAEQHKKGYEP